jgi:uroporphyrinogen-III synthase
MTSSLSGVRVLVTRAAQQAGKLSEALRAQGAIPVEVPLLEILPPESFLPFDAALQRLSSYDWLILSSANAVRAFVERAATLGIPLHPSQADSQAERPSQSPDSRQKEEALHGFPRLAVVGRATAEAARKTNLTVTVVPEKYLAESLITALHTFGLAGKRFLLARAAIARDLIPEALREAGAEVEVVDAYRNQMPEGAIDQLRAAMSEGVEVATFTSSSSATHLLEATQAAGISWPIPGVAAVSIGPITSATLRELSWEVAAEADPHDIPGLVAAVEKWTKAENRA